MFVNADFKQLMCTSALYCTAPLKTAETIHLVIDGVVHLLVRLNSDDPFVHHKRWLHCNDISS